jgi:hypothetical protein
VKNPGDLLVWVWGDCVVPSGVMSLDREDVWLCEECNGVDGEIPGDSGEDAKCAKEKEGEEGEQHQQRPSGHACGRRGRRGVVTGVVGLQRSAAWYYMGPVQVQRVRESGHKISRSDSCQVLVVTSLAR